MSFSKPNASAATRTRTRVTPAPISGMCVTCLDGCLGLCEIGQSALRGREVIYPQPFGKVTAGSEKDYPIDFSHFNIQGSCVGARGIEADSDKAIFPAVDLTTAIGAKGRERKMRVPFMTGALGSTEIARINWEGAAIATAISGSIIVCGENVCGMDSQAEFKNGKVVNSPELARRVKAFRDWYDGYGMMLVQANVEDTRLGVHEYAIEKLGVEGVEIKWGQGAKDIGGEVKLPSLERAALLKSRGYVVFPDPEDPVIQESFKAKGFDEFERHSRLGMVEEESFLKRVETLRKIGAKYISLKTGAYRPADLARAVKFASEAKIDLLTVDGAGGGTGMSPWPMMNEWGIPTVYIECLLYNYLSRLEKKGAFIPSCAIAGGIAIEDHVFKGIALAAPYIKTVCIGRATLAAAMVGKANGEKLHKDHPNNGYDEALAQAFVNVGKLKEQFGKDFSRIPPSAIGMYNYYDRLATGLRQLMAGERKFKLNLIDRTDLMALTREAAEISGIAYVMDADKAEVDKILG
ncbi:MAG: FMN-binding glutamate synthase family protein [Dehalococcoidales bacterium]|nr:FMN-binding glutamate synthase family protein [Dehalococcoidales bacterium]